MTNQMNLPQIIALQEVAGSNLEALGETPPLHTCFAPEAPVLSAGMHLSGIETLGVAFLPLHGADQFGLVQLATFDTPFPGNRLGLCQVHD